MLRINLDRADGFWRPSNGDQMNRSRLTPALICILWGGNIVPTQITVDSLPVLEALTLRMFISLVILVPIVSFHRRTLSLSPDARVGIVIVGALNALVFFLQYVSMRYTSASHIAILIYLQPFFTALLAHKFLSGDTLTIRKALGLCLGFSGATLTMIDHADEIGLTKIVGDLLAIAAAFAWAAQTVCTKQITTRADPLCIIFYRTLLSTAAFGAALLAAGSENAGAMSSLTVLAITYQTVVVDTICGVAWIALMKSHFASVLASYTFIAPVAGVAASVVFLDEPLGRELFVGMCLIAAALLVIDGNSRWRRLRVAPRDGLLASPQPIPDASRHEADNHAG